MEIIHGKDDIGICWYTIHCIGVPLYRCSIVSSETIWLAEESFRAGQFFSSGPLWNATSRSGSRAKTEEWDNFKTKKSAQELH
jgi:hypothetical protein